jgi:hypothetical protein
MSNYDLILGQVGYYATLVVVGLALFYVGLWVLTGLKRIYLALSGKGNSSSPSSRVDKRTGRRGIGPRD